jgi:hypothetical protein
MTCRRSTTLSARYGSNSADGGKVNATPSQGSRVFARAMVLQRKTQRPEKNLRAVQLLLGHTKLESTVRYLGEVDDALEIAEQTEV